MALPTDPTVRLAAPPRVCALQAPDLCHWCLGAGKYLEALDCDIGGAYLPVVCASCTGTGRINPH